MGVFWDSVDKQEHSLVPHEAGNEDSPPADTQASPEQWDGAEEAPLEWDAEEAPLVSAPDVKLGKGDPELKKRVLIYGGIAILALFLLMAALGGHHKSAASSSSPTTTNYGPATTAPKSQTTSLYASPQDVVNAAAQLAQQKFAGKGSPDAKQLVTYLKDKLGLPVTATGSPSKGAVGVTILPTNGLIIQYQDPKSDVTAVRMVSLS